MNPQEQHYREFWSGVLDKFNENLLREIMNNTKQPWEIVLDRMIDQYEQKHIDSWWNPFSSDYSKWILLWEVKRQIEFEEELRDRNHGWLEAHRDLQGKEDDGVV